MKNFFVTLSILATFIATSATAQISVETASPTTTKPEFKNEIKNTGDALPEFSAMEAQRRDERRKIRKERNNLEINVGLNGSLSNFNTKWQSVNGNANSITAIASFLVSHKFTKGSFTIDNKATGKVGVTSQDSEWKKSQDEWFISTAPAFKFSPNWNFGAILSLRSQFANGFDGNRVHTSSFFAPAYMQISLGFTYVCPKEKFPVKINLSPISLSATYVESEAVRNIFYNKKFGTKSLAELESTDRIAPYVYGLTINDGTSRYEGGSSVQIDFDRTFGKKGIFRYRTTFYSFYGWINEITQQCSEDKAYYDHLAPTIRWEHTVDIKATKWFSTQFYFQMYYNKAQIQALQTQIVLGVGLSYTFKNK